MARLESCRLLLETEPGSGAWNMAVDAALLETAATWGRATFRWYRWSEPTLSLGYFQDAAEVAADPRWQGVPMVRRLTGGGAILHDDEWTYSLALPARQTLFRRPEELYDVVHQAIIEVMRVKEFPLSLRGEASAPSPEPLLCFSRRDAHDVVHGGYKLLGSAQRRRKGAVLQHGSLLLRHSPLTPDHLGLHDLGWTGGLSLWDRHLVVQMLADEIAAETLSADEMSQVDAKLRERAAAEIAGPMTPGTSAITRGNS